MRSIDFGIVDELDGVGRLNVGRRVSPAVRCLFCWAHAYNNSSSLASSPSLSCSSSENAFATFAGALRLTAACFAVCFAAGDRCLLAVGCVCAADVLGRGDLDRCRAADALVGLMKAASTCGADLKLLAGSHVASANV